jgi:hypothetical protein
MTNQEIDLIAKALLKSRPSVLDKAGFDAWMITMGEVAWTLMGMKSGFDLYAFQVSAGLRNEDGTILRAA